MQKISNILFFTILICVQISIDTKNLKTRKLASNAATNVKIVPKPVDIKNIPITKTVTPTPSIQITKSDDAPSTGKTVAPITKKKLTKKADPIKPINGTVVFVSIPARNRKLGKGKKINARKQKSLKASKKSGKKAKNNNNAETITVTSYTQIDSSNKKIDSSNKKKNLR